MMLFNLTMHGQCYNETHHHAQAQPPPATHHSNVHDLHAIPINNHHEAFNTLHNTTNLSSSIGSNNGSYGWANHTLTPHNLPKTTQPIGWWNLW